ncbi:Tryptophan synthase alpha chain [Minicystis rosea]|nr:Tryptophan synthase alpha chain [Minicystis rosea]
MTRILVSLWLVAGAACSLVASLDDLQFKDTDCIAPCDDGNPCTQNDCRSGTACVGKPTPEHGACVVGDLEGICLGGTCHPTCATDTACDDKNPCTLDTCSAATLMCVHENIDGAPTPPLPQVVGDCHVHTCVAGVDTNLVDDTDLPDANNPCVAKLCSNGVPSTLPMSAGTACGNQLMQVCNDSGKCGCTEDGDCAAPDTCGGGDPGTPGTCGCTKRTCKDLGVTCGILVFADGCGGNLDCNDHSDSPMPDGSETDVDCGGHDPMTCTTRCAQGKKCNETSDCVEGLLCVDGICCNEACPGACKACNVPGKLGTCAPTPKNVPDQTPPYCNGGNTCDGQGACKFKAGHWCNASDQCVNYCKTGVCH